MHHNTDLPIRVKKIDMFVSPSYTDQFYRPYSTDVGSETLVDAVRHATADGQAMSAESISSIAGQILRPTTNHSGAAGIANGWNNSRLVFVMEVIVDGIWDTQTVQYISGYSDYPGVSASGAIDPQMRLYFNTAMTFRSVQRHIAGQGVVPQVGLQHATNIIAPYDGNLLDHNAAGHMLRPIDLVNSIQTESIMGAAVANGFDATRARDMTTAAAGNVSLSRISNGNAPEYLSRVFKAMSKVASMLDSGHVSEEEKFGLLSGAVNEPSVTEFNIVHELSRRVGYGSTGNDGSVSWQELMELFPQVDSVTSIHTKGGLTPMASMHDPMATESMGASTPEAIAANIVSSALPSILTQCMLSEFNFTITNETSGGPMPYVIIPGTNVQTMAKKADHRRLAQIAMDRIIAEICPAVSNGNSLTFHISVAATMLRDTCIFVRINGGNQIPFVVPSWGSSVTTPVAHSTQANLAMMANDIDYLYGRVSDPGEVHGPGGPLDYPGYGMAGGASPDYSQHEPHFEVLSGDPNTPPAHETPAPATLPPHLADK